MKHLRIIDSFHTSQWSGGTTTELFIYPKGSSLQKQDFDFRLSKATIEASPSVFTALGERVWRTFMLMEGEVSLQPKDQAETMLRPYETLEFGGDQPVTSTGLGSPLNLMTTGKNEARLRHVHLETSSNYELATTHATPLFLAYLHKGTMAIKDLGKDWLEGQLLVLENGKTQVQAKTACDIVLTELFQ